MNNKQGVPAPAFVKRIGAIVDQRRSVEFRPLETEELVNRLKDPRFPFGWTVNPFRGCEFGCRYCYARPTHGYLGHADPAEFESRIYVKQAHPSKLASRLRRALESGEEVAIGAVTDPYQPAEARFEVTRRVLEAIARVPGLRVGITTKSAGIARDVELLTEIAGRSDLIVNISLASMNAQLLRRIEPRAPRPDLRLEAMAKLVAAGVPARLFAMPVLPFLTDTEVGLRTLFTEARQGGLVRQSGMCSFSAGRPTDSSWSSSDASSPSSCRATARSTEEGAPPTLSIASASSGSPRGSRSRPAFPRGAGPSAWPRSGPRARASYCSSGSWTGSSEAGGSGALSTDAALRPFCSMRGRNFS